MPIHPDWQELYRGFVEQYGEEKGEEVFYAYCKKHGINYAKPYPKVESFSWVGDLKSEGSLIRGKALHPIKTVHPAEWPEVRVYLEEELRRSAETLKDKPLLLDHLFPVNGKVSSAAYEDGAIEYIAEVSDPLILGKIRDGKIKHCSVEFDWKSLDRVNGIAPRGINFVGLSLLEKFLPGDPQSSVEIWEGILKRLKETKSEEQAEPQEFIYYPVRNPAAFLEDRFSTVWIDRFNGIQGIYGRLRDAPENPQPMALLFMRTNSWDMDRVKSWVQEHPQYVKTEPSTIGVQAGPTPPSQTGLIGEKEMEKQILMERVWDRAYISNLPDSAFALIQSGGEKDETGRIVPRSLRRLPHHGADGSIDLPHLRNALARASQMKDVSEEERNGAIAHLQRHAKAAGIDESAEAQREPLKHAWKEQEAPVEFQIAPEPTMDELIVSIEDLVEQINLRLDILEAKDKKPEGEPLGEAKKQIEVVRNQLGMVTEQKKTLEGALKDSEAKIRTLEERLSKPLGEAVIEPNAAQPSVPEGCLRKDDIRALLPERVPTYWGYGPYELVRRLKHVLGE